MLYNSLVTEEKFKCKCIDSYDVVYLKACYVELLFRCYYSIGSSVDYHGSVLFRGFTFKTVLVELAPKQN